MKNLSFIVVLLFSLERGFAGVAQYPSFTDLWKTADVVFMSDGVEILEDDYQEDLPQDEKLEYLRVNLHFPVSKLLKGKLEDDERDTWVNFYIAYLKEGVEDDGTTLQMFGSEPYLREPGGEFGERYIVFYKRDVYGRLVPVHEKYFLHMVTRGYRVNP